MLEYKCENPNAWGGNDDLVVKKSEDICLHLLSKSVKPCNGPSQESLRIKHPNSLSYFVTWVGLVKSSLRSIVVCILPVNVCKPCLMTRAEWVPKSRLLQVPGS